MAQGGQQVAHHDATHQAGPLFYPNQHNPHVVPTFPSGSSHSAPNSLHYTSQPTYQLPSNLLNPLLAQPTGSPTFPVTLVPVPEASSSGIAVGTISLPEQQKNIKDDPRNPLANDKATPKGRCGRPPGVENGKKVAVEETQEEEEETQVAETEVSTSGKCSQRKAKI